MYSNNFLDQQKLRFDLKIILTIVFTLTILGLLFIYSSSCIFASEKFGSSFYFVKKQVLGLFLALLLFVIASYVPLNLIRKFSFLLFFGSLFITFLTLIPGIGRTIHGSCRWLAIGGFAFQPSELLKISLFLYLANVAEKKRYKNFSFISTYLPLLLILGLTVVVLLMQPDFGLTVTLFVTFFIVFFIVRLQFKYLLITLLSALPAIFFLILLKPYRIKRLFTYLNPWSDPQGAGFQIIQSLIAIGAGGSTGVGIAQSKQKFFYLPMQHTDFIFSIIAEETGFIGSFIIVFLFGLFLYLGIKIALKLKSFYAMFITLSFVILLSLQSIINIGVAAGIFPTKGIGLPFVSYGNSCLISSFIMIGLIVNSVLDNNYA
jgi:cell division protein FtsW